MSSTCGKMLKHLDGKKEDNAQRQLCGCLFSAAGHPVQKEKKFIEQHRALEHGRLPVLLEEVKTLGKLKMVVDL